ncbi:MAG: ribosomal-processing cysteine protease Prp [Clostridia bacterium]|nr:ribosomal-processing cysteine protease Prp [Clostridia bacterium]
MINIEFSRAEGNISLKMRGHAGYSREGEDIVCAAVSGIFYALLGFLANEESAGLSVSSLASGNVEIACAERFSSSMRLAYIGFLQIAMSYPGTARVFETVWGGEIKAPVNTAIA